MKLEEEGRVHTGGRGHPGGPREGLCPAQLALSTAYLCPPVGPAPSRKETLVEETTTESSDDEVVAPSQVTAKGRAGNLRNLRTGASGQALPTQCSLRLRSPPK